MSLALPRRGFLLGALSLVAAPAIVRAGSLMPVRGVPLAAADVYFQQATADWGIITDLSCSFGLEPGMRVTGSLFPGGPFYGIVSRNADGSLGIVPDPQNPVRRA